MGKMGKKYTAAKKNGTKLGGESKQKEKAEGKYDWKIGRSMQLLVTVFALVYYVYRRTTSGEGIDLKYNSTIYGRPARWNKNIHTVKEFSRNLEVALSAEHPLYADMLNFKQKVLDASHNGYVLVVFYDPFSSQYKELGSEFEEAGIYLRENVQDVPLSRKASIIMVNIATNNFLGRKYAPEQRFKWLGMRERRGEWSYEFGSPNLFAMAVKVFFKGQTLPLEFHDRITKDNILRFLRTFVEPVVSVNDPAELKNVLENRDPSFHYCNPPSDDCTQASNNFDELVKRVNGGVFFSIITDINLCQSLTEPVPVDACTVIAASKSIGIHSIPGNSSISELEQFVNKYNENSLPFLTASTVSSFLLETHYTVLLLIDQENKKEFDRAEEVIKRLAYKFKDTKLRFAWVHGPLFVQDFGLVLADLPNLVYYSTMQVGYSVYAPPFDRDEIGLPFVGETIDDDFNQISTWIQRAYDGISLLTEGDLDARLITKENNVDASKMSTEENELPKYYTTSEDESNLPLVDDLWQLRRKEARQYFRYKFSRLWVRSRELYFRYLELEEIYASFSDEQKQEEMAFHFVLSKVRSYLAKAEHKHHSDFFLTIPATTELLKNTIESDERINLLRQIERYDAYRIYEANKFKRDGNDDIKYMLANLASVLDEAVIYLHKSRGDELLAKKKGIISLEDQQLLPVERIAAADLSLEDFVNKYASKGKPVIITGLQPFKLPLSMERLVEVCGSVPLELKRKTQVDHWGGLEDVAEEYTMSKFIHEMQAGGPARQYYLHDFSIPLHCPELMGEFPHDDFLMPKYFAGDLFQRIPFSTFQHSWPSLFVGANGTESQLHVDNGGTHFWMYLESGEKEWYVFDRLDVHNLYIKASHSAFSVNVFDPDLDTFPLFVKSKMYKFTQKPGELVFIPAEFPHAVQNKDDIVGFSMNYVDKSNLYYFLRHLLMREKFRAFEEAVNKDTPKGLLKKQEDLPFSRFKSMNPFETAFDF